MSVNKIKIEGAKLKKAVYPGILMAYLIVLAVILILTAKFLSAQINRIFESNDIDSGGVESRTLDLDNYRLLAQRLGLSFDESPKTVVPEISDSATQPIATSSEMTATSTPSPVSAAAPEPAATSTPEPEPAVAKEPPKETELSIYVINSTKKTGLAAGLKKDLEAAGLLVAGTGNQAKKESLTLLKIKPSVVSSKLETVKRIISAQYIFEEKILPDSSRYNIEIVIGGN